eukprot:scaffold129570_cov31-Tisochrysis_lutea.AAC.1
MEMAHRPTKPIPRGTCCTGKVWGSRVKATNADTRPTKECVSCLIPHPHLASGQQDTSPSPKAGAGTRPTKECISSGGLSRAQYSPFCPMFEPSARRKILPLDRRSPENN